MLPCQAHPGNAFFYWSKSILKKKCISRFPADRILSLCACWIWNVWLSQWPLHSTDSRAPLQKIHSHANYWNIIWQPVTFWAAIILIFFLLRRAKSCFHSKTRLNKVEPRMLVVEFDSFLPKKRQRGVTKTVFPPLTCPNKWQMVCTSGRKVKDVPDKTLRTLSRF